MEFHELSEESKALLAEIAEESNPSDFLYGRFDNLSRSQDYALRSNIRELCEAGFIRVMWADNRPYHVFVNESAIKSANTNNQGEKHSTEVPEPTIIYYGNNNSIRIGSNTTISNSSIGQNVKNRPPHLAHTFYERHPALCSLLISILAGLILLFPFWAKLMQYIWEMF